MTNVQIRDNIMYDYQDEIDFRFTDGLCFQIATTNKVFITKSKYYKPDRFFLFSLLHEIGHYKTTEITWDNCLDYPTSLNEYRATVWAIKVAGHYGCTPSKRTLRTYQEYIYNKLKEDRQQHKKNIPTKKQLTFFKEV